MIGLINITSQGKKQQQSNRTVIQKIQNKFQRKACKQVIFGVSIDGVNYYKGVLLCSRPNESPSVQRQKPFCGRVNPQQSLGLVPTKQYNEHQTRKRQLPVLNNHKKWLEGFKRQVEQKKNKETDEEKRRQQNLEKIRQEGRQRIKEISTKQFYPENNTVSLSVQSPEKPKKVQNPHKKKAKPVWAQTEQQAEYHEEEKVDELLDFFQKGETQQVKDYVNDDDIKKILVELKSKIVNLREQGNQWKHQEMIKIEDENKKQIEDSRRHHHDPNDDILSRISKQSGSQSVTSQKTVDRVEQLEKKKETKEWDKMTTTSKKSSLVSVDEQIAKHIADQILRNYPNLKHHSNQSIRKLLEKQAREELKTDDSVKI